jgi:hypothetical protein
MGYNHHCTDGLDSSRTMLWWSAVPILIISRRNKQLSEHGVFLSGEASIFHFLGREGIMAAKLSLVLYHRGGRHREDL